MPGPDIDKATQSKVRGDHTHWRCMHGSEDNPCYTRLEMTQENCTVCGNGRKVGSGAEAHNEYQLGTLQSFGPNGEAIWHYETARNGCS